MKVRRSARARREARAAPHRQASSDGRAPREARTLLLLALFVAAGLAIYGVAFQGPFLADDLHYIPQNPYVTDPSPGRLLEVPLITILDGDDMLLFGTAAGSPTHPSWYYNLRAHPEIDIEYGGERFRARVYQLT